MFQKIRIDILVLRSYLRRPRGDCWMRVVGLPRAVSPWNDQSPIVSLTMPHVVYLEHWHSMSPRQINDRDQLIRAQFPRPVHPNIYKWRVYCHKHMGESKTTIIMREMYETTCQWQSYAQEWEESIRDNYKVPYVPPQFPSTILLASWYNQMFRVGCWRVVGCGLWVHVLLYGTREATNNHRTENLGAKRLYLINLISVKCDRARD